MKNNIINNKYKSWLQDLKQNFQKAQIKAHIQVNSTLLEFYWQLGNDIIKKQKEFEWGSGFLEQLSMDLSAELPNVKGFSYSNLKNIRQWVTFWQQVVAKTNTIKSQQLVGELENIKGEQLVAQLTQIPWGHNIAIIQKCKNVEEALFYVKNTLQNGISRAVLIHQIESDLYKRSAKAITNFENTLPPIQSDLAKQITKDPYNFDFIFDLLRRLNG